LPFPKFTPKSSLFGGIAFSDKLLERRLVCYPLNTLLVRSSAGGCSAMKQGA
jgi:hypothetical protein